MRVLISDYKEQMEADYSLTIEKLKEILPDCTIVVEPYDTEAFYRELEMADGMITAFLPVDEALLGKAPKLKCISQNSVGYSNVDLEALKKHDIALCHIREYCTREVSEHAMLEGYRYLKWSYVNGVLHVEAWLRGSFGGEWGFTGFVGCVMKKPYRESLEMLFETLQQEIPEPQQNQDGTMVINVKTADNSPDATTSLILGIFSLVLCCIPLLSVIFGAISCMKARKSFSSSKRNSAIAGMVLSIIGMIISIFVFLICFMGYLL